MSPLFGGEQRLEGILIELCADHAEPAGNGGAAFTQGYLPGHKVEVEPVSFFALHDALCTQHGAEALFIRKGVEGFFQGSGGELVGGLDAPAHEHLVRMVMPVLVVLVTAGTFVTVVMFVMIVTAAAFAIVVVVLVVVVTAAALAIVVMLMMLVTAAALVTVVMFVMVVAAAALVIMVVMFVMIVAAAALVTVVMFVMIVAAAALVTVMMVLVMIVTAGTFLIVVMVVLFLLQRFHGGGKGILLFHGGKNLRTGKLVPGGGDDHGFRVVFPEKLHRCRQLIRLDAVRTGKDQGAGVLHLIVEELAEVFHVHFAFIGIHHGGGAVKGKGGFIDALDGTDHVAQLAHAGRLDKDAVGRKIPDHFFQGVRKVAHKAAADAAGVHFRDLHACILQETAIHGDLAEFVFDQNQLFAFVGLPDQFFDEGGLTGAEKAGENVDLCHGKSSSFRSRAARYF